MTDLPFDQTVVATLSAPWSIAFLPDGRLLVTERPPAGTTIPNPTDPGHIRIVTQAGEISVPIAGLPENVGILDVILDPNFAQNHIVYFSYLERDPAAPRLGRDAGDPSIDPAGLAVARGVLDPDAVGGPTLSSTEVVWRQEPKVVSFPGSGEPGGRLAFSPDGSFLYIAAGDRQEFGPVQTLDDSLGKIIRIYPDGTIPDDNPFAGVPGALPEIWTLGHRNPYGLLFTPDGRLWEHEMGPMGGDELNIIRPGENYGWPNVSYGDFYDGTPIPKPADGDGYAPSQLWWTPVIAPSGMTYYSGTAFPQWQGDLIISGLQSHGLVIVGVDGTTAVEEQRIDLGGRIRDVVQAPDGSLWIIYDQPDGRLVHLTPPAGSIPGSPMPQTVPASDPLSQSDLSSASLPNGERVVVSTESVGSESHVVVRISGADGQRVGADIVVGTASRGDLGEASVAPTADGGFVVAYGSRDQGAFAVHARFFHSDGTPAGDAMLVNSSDASFHSPPAVTVLADGDVVVSWLGTSAAHTTDVRAQLFAANGARIGGEILVSDHAEAGKMDEHVVALAGGGFAISWTDSRVEADPYGNSNTGVRVQVFDASGNKAGGVIAVNSATAGNQDLSSIAALPGGGFIVGWRDDGYAYGGSTSTQGIWGQMFDSAGAKIGAPIHVTNLGDYGFTPAVTMLPGIGIAFVWQDTPVDGARNVEARLYDFSGQPLGPDFAVAADPQSIQAFPTATGGLNGQLLLAWQASALSTPADFHEQAASFHVAVGTAGGDALVGTGAADLLFGLAGNDTIGGGAGADFLSGGDGNDIFSGTAAALGGDTIVDLAPGERIVVTDATLSGFTYSLAGSALSFSGGSVTLQNLPHHPYFQVSAAAGGGVQLTLQTHDPRDDFNGDGLSDVLLRNSTGTIGDWLGMANGQFRASDAHDVDVSNYWHVIGTGDFDGDGKDDILWRGNSGEVGDWLGLANGGFQYNASVGVVAVPWDWHVVGTGDFNGDGRDDILWRNDDGRVGNWLANHDGGFTPNQSSIVGVPTDWKVAATGDFNGDGFFDILWRNADGTIGDWLGGSGGGFTINNSSLVGVPNDWHVAGAGDFNGDGFDDILWRNDNGALGDWQGTANGTFTVNQSSLVGVPTIWTVVDVGDYNGDGRDDILWRHDDGRVGNWLGQSDGGFIHNTESLISLSTSWHVQSSDSFWL